MAVERILTIDNMIRGERMELQDIKKYKLKTECRKRKRVSVFTLIMFPMISTNLFDYHVRFVLISVGFGDRIIYEYFQRIE